MATSYSIIVGGILGGLVLLLMIIVISWFCVLKLRRGSLNRNSDDTGSSAPSVVERKRGLTTSPSLQEGREFRLEDLEQATIHFNENNIIGFGKFGMVFKGLLFDGTVVAIKRHIGTPCQQFVQEVKNLSRLQHGNLVNLIGFCQESGYQILVYEYLPNGSICNYLYDTGKDEATKLEIKQRLSIAVGAAKGLRYLHGRNPCVVHGDFKAANVLLDENFIAKVSDAGMAQLLEKIEDAGPSTSSSLSPLKDPELVPTSRFSQTSDVYNFGIFLLELITGKETSNTEAFESNDNVVQRVKEHLPKNELVDNSLVGSYTAEGTRDLVKLILQCTTSPERLRPTMETVVTELERILEKEIMLTTGTVEGGPTVTLGSQLFTK